jgi:hypothetical protein
MRGRLDEDPLVSELEQPGALGLREPLLPRSQLPTAGMMLLAAAIVTVIVLAAALGY